MIYHVGTFKLADPSRAQEAVDAILRLKDLVPGTLDYKVGTCFNPTPTNADVCLIGVFDNAVLPMGTDTGLREDFAEFAGGIDEMIEYGTGAAHRMALPREMGEPAVFLGSRMASFISGAMLSVDYGMLLPMTAGIEHFAFGNPGLMTFDF